MNPMMVAPGEPPDRERSPDHLEQLQIRVRPSPPPLPLDRSRLQPIFVRRSQPCTWCCKATGVHGSCSACMAHERRPRWCRRPASNLGFRSCRACQVIPGASSRASLTSVAAPEQHLFLARSGDAGHLRLCDAFVHRLQGRGGAAGGRLQPPVRRRRRSWTACCRALPTRRGCTRSTGWGRRAPAPPVRRPPLPPDLVTCHPPSAFSPELSWPPFCSTLHIQQQVSRESTAAPVTIGVDVIWHWQRRRTRDWRTSHRVCPVWFRHSFNRGLRR